MSNLKLFSATYCPFCDRVVKYIKDNNIENIEVINIDENKEMRDFLIEKGGKKQVPCLFIDDEPMYESREIIEYLKGLIS